MSTPEPLPVEGSDLDERIAALQRSIEWRSSELLVQTLHKLNAWRDRTRSDAADRIEQLEAAQATDRAELRKQLSGAAASPAGRLPGQPRAGEGHAMIEPTNKRGRPQSVGNAGEHYAAMRLGLARIQTHLAGAGRKRCGALVPVSAL